MGANLDSSLGQNKTSNKGADLGIATLPSQRTRPWKDESVIFKESLWRVSSDGDGAFVNQTWFFLHWRMYEDTRLDEIFNGCGRRFGIGRDQKYGHLNNIKRCLCDGAAQRKYWNAM